MSTVAVPPFRPPIDYPDSDGLPMAENTLQYQWIVTIVTGLRHLFEDNPNIFIAGDLFWYPVEGHPEIRMAPDALVAFGRPIGDRGSYRQWEEGGIAPQAVFEVLSPGNRPGEMAAKLNFYDLHGAEEYYVIDPGPDIPQLSGYLRQQARLIEIEKMSGHVSPRLGIKFVLSGQELTILRPDGEPFMPAEEIARLRDEERQRADQECRRADLERHRADKASNRANQADERAQQERDRADRLQRELDQLRRRSSPPPKPGDA